MFKFTDSFLSLIHYAVELIFLKKYFSYIIISKIFIWFFFVAFISLLKLCIFSFVLRMFVIAH